MFTNKYQEKQFCNVKGCTKWAETCLNDSKNSYIHSQKYMSTMGELEKRHRDLSIFRSIIYNIILSFAGCHIYPWYTT